MAQTEKQQWQRRLYAAKALDKSLEALELAIYHLEFSDYLESDLNGEVLRALRAYRDKLLDEYHDLAY